MADSEPRPEQEAEDEARRVRFITDKTEIRDHVSYIVNLRCGTYIGIRVNKGSVGIELAAPPERRTKNGITIFKVPSKSIADAGVLKIGDQLVLLENHDMTNMSFKDAMSLFQLYSNSPRVIFFFRPSTEKAKSAKETNGTTAKVVHSPRTRRGRVAGRKRKTPSRKDKGSQLPSDKAVVDVESVSAQVSNAHDIIDLLDSSDDEGQTPASTAGTPSLPRNMKCLKSGNPPLSSLRPVRCQDGSKENANTTGVDSSRKGQFPSLRPYNMETIVSTPFGEGVVEERQLRFVKSGKNQMRSDSLTHLEWDKNIQQVRLEWGAVGYVKVTQMVDLGSKTFCRYLPKSKSESARRQKPITITRADFYRLRPKHYLNDTLVDVCIQRLVETKMSKTALEKVHIFNTHFFQLLQKGREVDLVNIMNKKRDEILNKKFLLFPVCQFTHWSLVMVCNLNNDFQACKDFAIVTMGNNIRQKCSAGTDVGATKGNEMKRATEDNEFKGKLEDTGKIGPRVAHSNSPKESQQDLSAHTEVPCILLFDSLGHHRAQDVFRKLRSLFTKFLKHGNSDEIPRLELQREDVEETVDTKLSAGKDAEGPVVAQNEAQQSDGKPATNEPKGKQRTLNLTAQNLPGFSVQDLPRQKNGWDCGVFIALYMEAIVCNLKGLDTSFFYVIRNRKKLFKNVDGPKLFGEKDADDYREGLQRYLQSFVTKNISIPSTSRARRSSNKRQRLGVGEVVV